MPPIFLLANQARQGALPITGCLVKVSTVTIASDVIIACACAARDYFKMADVVDTRIKQRVVIKFLTAKGVSLITIHAGLKKF